MSDSLLALVPAFPLLGVIIIVMLNRRASRKVAGAMRTQLTGQFLIEAAMLNATALVTAVLLATIAQGQDP